MADHYSLFYTDTGEYSACMTLEEAKACSILFNVSQYIVDILTGEIIMEV